LQAISRLFKLDIYGLTVTSTSWEQIALIVTYCICFSYKFRRIVFSHPVSKVWLSLSMCTYEQIEISNKKVNLFFNKWFKIFLYFNYCSFTFVVYDDIMCILQSDYCCVCDIMRILQSDYCCVWWYNVYTPVRLLLCMMI